MEIWTLWADLRKLPVQKAFAAIDYWKRFPQSVAEQLLPYHANS
jgi:hypothetical protein